jgi:hypothetical protein
VHGTLVNNCHQGVDVQRVHPIEACHLEVTAVASEDGAEHRQQISSMQTSRKFETFRSRAELQQLCGRHRWSTALASLQCGGWVFLALGIVVGCSDTYGFPLTKPFCSSG